MSADSLQLTCYLTPLKIPSVETINTSSGGVIYLVPADYSGQEPPLKLSVNLIQPGYNPIGCKYKPKVSVGHVWTPDPNQDGSIAPFKSTACIVKVALPRSPFWSGAEINPELSGGPLSIGPTPAKASGGGGTDDSLLIPKSGWELNLMPVPGEPLPVTHHTHGHGSWTIAGYHTCPGLTGGWILAKRPHPIVDEAYLYDVDVEGAIFTNLLATDFELRMVGDWCFLLRGISAAADLTFGHDTPKSPEDGETLRLAPLLILGKG